MGNPIGVIIVGPDLKLRGGISTVIAEYIHGGLGKRANLLFIPTYSDRNFLFKSCVFFSSVFKVIANARRHKIIHLLTSHRGSFVRKYILFCIAKIFGCHCIVHIHGSSFGPFMKTNRVISWFASDCFRRASVVIVLSENFKNEIKSYTEVRKIYVLPNPVAIKPIKETRSNEHTRVLFMGRLGERKGVHDIISVVSQYSDYFKAKKVRITLAGDGDTERYIREIRTKSLEDIIDVPGWQSGKAKEELFLIADFLILPSYEEQMPMSILEAMSYGMPVISTRIAAIPEIIRDGENGFLIEPGDQAKLFEYMKQLIEDPNKRCAMGLKAVLKIQKKHDVQVVLDQLMKIYELVVNENQ